MSLVFGALTALFVGHSIPADIDTLQKRLDERDALIQELQRRLDALEKKSADQPIAPGGLVDEEIERALERTLAREGALVLPPRTFELEPRLEYSHRSREGLGIVGFDDVLQVAAQVARRDRVEASLGVRVGLPRALQAELRVPYGLMRETVATGAAVRETTQQDGFGDVELGVTKLLTRAALAHSGLLGSVRWRAASGRFRLDEPSIGAGFPLVQAALTAVRRQDPLVFFGTLSYAFVLERTHFGRDIDPGNVAGMRLGAILAASPQTSLRGAVEISRQGRTRLDGHRVPGSDAISAALQLGLATLLTPRALLDIGVEIGLTPDAPDFRLNVSLPIRM